MAEKFAGYSDDLEFYRSEAYAASKSYPWPQKRALRNLAQSVYAYCELRREEAAGTYFGSRIAEIPPTDDEILADDSRIHVVPIPGEVQVPVASNIGEIVSNVLDECGEEMRLFWALGAGSKHPESAFVDAWAHVADAFARHSVKAKQVHTREKTSRRWHRTSQGLHLAVIVTEAGAFCGFKFLNHFAELPFIQGPLIALTAIASFGDLAVSAIRKGRAYDKRDTERDRVRRILLDSATLRGAQIQ